MPEKSDEPRATLETIEKSPNLQLAKVDPTLKGQRYSVLLNFELPTDDAFVAAPSGKIKLDTSKALTGVASLLADNGTKRINVKLSSLLVGRPFPANWTLLGGSIYIDKPAMVGMVLELADGTVRRQSAQLKPASWNTLWLDISTLPADASPTSLYFEINGKTDAWFDDIILTDNDHWYIGKEDSSEPWSIHRRGYQIAVQSPGKFKASLDTVLGKPGGFVVDEVCSHRARFSSNGDVKELTIYADGRSFWDGEYRALSPQARSEPADQHKSPAAVAVPAEMGRVNRRTVGDLNNDGYNERVGAYQVTAATPRVDVTLTPRGASLQRPIIEIANLPAGNVLVTVEGRLVEDFVRTPSGTLLIRLPFKIDRATTINVRVN